MGCSLSKLDDEESVQLCKARKKFIKQAVEQRLKFAMGHIAYMQSMKRVSVALREYIEVDEPREFLLDSFTKPPYNTPVKTKSPGFIAAAPFKPESKTSYRINYYRPSGNPSISVEERLPQNAETFRVEAHSPVHRFGMDSIFQMQSSPMNSSFFHYSPNNHAQPNYSPSPQRNQWDFFWNPFSSLDYYGYPTRSSVDRTFLDDENDGLWQVREEEGIPELEEETEPEEIDDRVDTKQELDKVGMGLDKEEVVIEDADSSEDRDDDSEEDEPEVDKNIRGSQSPEHQNLEVEKTGNVDRVSSQETIAVDGGGSKQDMPGFTVYVNKRPTSMAEVMKDLEDQFTAACNAAKEVSSILEANQAQYLSSTNDLTALKMLNPVVLFRSASSRSSSSRFLATTSSNNEAASESSSNYSEESCMLYGSHQSTLDRLYAWEKKLYQEVRAGERVRIAYEKKCAQLRKQDVRGEDASFVDKTRAGIRDLHTQIKVSIHSVEAISKRIETLRDEELEPQILELVQGLARMWEMMAECHQLQKRTLDEAKILLAGTPSKLSRTKKYTIMSPSEPHKLASSAANLETELRNWRSCFNSWIVSQRSYIHALTSWLLCCIRADPNSSKPPGSPQESLSFAPPIFRTCIQWSKLLDAVHEAPVLDGLDFFAAGVGSLYAQQMKENSGHSGGSRRFRDEFVGNKMEIVEAEHFEDEVMTAEKMAEVAIRVVCAGMSVSVSSLTEFAVNSAEGYADLMRKWEDSMQIMKGSKRIAK
ncbi:hypothetical protein F511_06648 [Dorcoceras hygrometricum]|uniref:DUF632 domain-containing protein n=1 Tax=Dorcoceras hygrometricum TaxID=472368 RepID=A0A2Z7AY40_9LAMI|nr:hypothetical protein F511_06648 [Dorcoceras hygrometricum]